MLFPGAQYHCDPGERFFGIALYSSLLDRIITADRSIYSEHLSIRCPEVGITAECGVHFMNLVVLMGMNRPPRSGFRITAAIAHRRYILEVVLQNKNSTLDTQQ
jgi:hypothetical protein